MNKKRTTNVFCMILCAITLIVGVVLPVPGSFAEEQYLNDASAEQLSVNYASPSNGAKYALTTLAGDKSEQEPEFYDVYRDDECTKLTDGIGTIGISENSVTFCGTAKTHRIKFDLSEKRAINNIVLYNVVIGNASQIQSSYSIKVTAGETVASVSEVEVNISEENNGAGDSYDIILDFDTVTARYVFITMSFPSYTVSLDEVGIYKKADSTFVYGDINGDGEIDSNDALAALKYDAGIADLSEEQLKAADVSGDGAVDSADAMMILKYDAGISTETTQQTTPDNPLLEGVPEIHTFSSTEYEQYEFQFSEIESAAILKNGEKQDIDIKDPRLYRLLNFIAYSHNSMLDIIRQGYVMEQEITEISQNKNPILEVIFTNVSQTSGSCCLAQTKKIWVYEDECLVFVNLENPGYYWATEVMADQIWPYLSLIFGSVENAQDQEWIDLLSYAGF